jgi:hypothetical protein
VEKKSIKISEETKERLSKMGDTSMTYDDVINHTLDKLEQSIEISEENRERLSERGSVDMTYDEVLTEVLDELEETEKD